jgi:hypothetical protein
MVGHVVFVVDRVRTIDFVLGVLNSISQACGKLSFHMDNYLYTQKEGRNEQSIECLVC